ncbi:MAG TPA: peptide chain release factor-like protein [Spirochaetota bacterium]|nr:peptide chain release factor-like protein [Spirochaetota bacterium]HNT09407.1 peptide chain release factor-like protein [Spirochaetota bacterium]
MAQKTKYSTDPDTLLAECEVDYYSGTGKGGQNRNRHYNCVRLRHRPTGIIALGTEERSQRKNFALALQRLLERIEALNYVKPKRVPTKPSAGAKKARIESKTRVAVKKSARKKVANDDDA